MEQFRTNRLHYSWKPERFTADYHCKPQNWTAHEIISSLGCSVNFFKDFKDLGPKVFSLMGTTGTTKRLE